MEWSALTRWERAEVGRALRRRGLSYGEIMQLIPVPKGTLAGWCRGIELTPEQAAAIVVRTGSRKGVPRDTQRKRREEVERIREEARAFAHEHLADPLWVAGTALYWGEGPSRNGASRRPTAIHVSSACSSHGPGGTTIERRRSS